MTQFNFGTIVASTKSGSGLASDLNAWRDAIHTQHKGPTVPTYRVPGLSWINDVNVPWEDYVWDGAVSTLRGFIDPVAHRYSTAGNFAKSVAGGMTAKLADWGTLFNCTGASAQTVAIDTKSSLLAGWWIRVVARSVGVTIAPFGAETIDGAATKLLDAGSSTTVFYDGANLYTDQHGGGLTDFPVGGVVMAPAINPPAGFLRLNGALVSRVTYAALWSFAQLSGNIVADASWTSGRFTTGDGASTFRLPDLRGEFPRFWDNSRGLDASRSIGTVQTDEFQSHTHSASMTVGGSAHAHTLSNGKTDTEGAHTHGMKALMNDSSGNTYVAFTNNGDSGTLMVTAPGGAHAHTVTGTISTDDGHTHPITVVAQGSTETRPRNVSLLACIKY